jgi:L-rhamnose mutarotase
MTTDARRTIAEELHRPARRNFPRRAVEIKGLHDLFQADLVEMIPHAKVNNGYKYLMTVINAFSKYAYAIPLKTKTGSEVARALEPVLRTNKMKYFQTDNGKEYYNSSVQVLMKKYNVKHYSTYSDKKASIVERFNRTLKTRMYRAFSEQGNYRWVKLLPALVKDYNNTVHRTIGMKPCQVNASNERVVLQRIKKNTAPKGNAIRKKARYKTGDRVRVSKHKMPFAKGYTPNWTNEIFTVHAVQPTVPVTYLLEDYTGEVLKGGFYEHELTKSTVGDVYLVEKILQRKGDRVRVRWLGFDGKHDTWIPKSKLL